MKFDASQKGTVIQSVIQYALLASNSSHPQIAGERVGKFMVVILDLNYKLMTDTKNYNKIMKMTDYKMTDYQKKNTTKKYTTKKYQSPRDIQKLSQQGKDLIKPSN
jgi:hypothetical protein